MLLLTLRGTPTLYYGDEIGMRDVPIPPERVQDPFEKNVPGHGPGPRPGAHADAVGRGRQAPASRRRRAVAAVSPDYAEGERARAARRPALDAVAVSAAHHAAPRRAGARDRALRTVSRLRTTSSPTFGGRAKAIASFLIVLNLGPRPQALTARPETMGAFVAVGTEHAREGEKIRGDIVLGPHEGVILRLL